MNETETFGRRKERRFKVCDSQSLQTHTFVDFADPVDGTVIDISTNGLRILSDGKFAVGQAILTELKTDRLHGVFPAVIRRIQPWVDGKSVLGCQLLEPVPQDVLAILADQGIVNRRDDDRVDWKQPAKMSWELTAGEVDIDIQDCSPGGLRISSQTPIPDDMRLRIRVAISNDEELIVNVKTCWQQANQDGVQAGLAFTEKKVPDALAPILSNAGFGTQHESIIQRYLMIRPSILIAGTIAILGLALFQTGLWG